MNLKKTLILSMFLHLCFFTAVLFLSADLSGDSSKLLDEEVFFIKLAEEISKSDEKRFIVKPNLTTATEKNPVSVKTDAPIENLVNIQPSKALKNYRPPLTPPVEGGETNAGSPFILPSPLVGEGKGEGLTNVSHESSSYRDAGVSVGKDRGESHTDIIEIIRNSIERAKTYPLLARKRGIEGTVYISFRIGPQGMPKNLTIIKGSGSSLLDTATMDIVKKAAPFPHIDSPIEVPVVFRLNE